MDTIQLQRIEDYLLSPTQEEELARLLSASFPGYPANRTYYLQLPSFRYLATLNHQLIGHLAVTHRIINAGGEPARIFGLGDLCVQAGYKRKKIGSLLLNTLEKEALQHQIDFLVLVSDDQAFYLSKGFTLIENICRWVSIRSHESIGLVQGRIPGSLWVKSLHGKKWGDGIVDLLGYMF